MGKHALQPGSPQARAIRRERLRLAPGHLLFAIPIICPAGLARYAASQHDSAGRVALWVLATAGAGVIVASVNAASKTLAARRNRPRSSWQYLLAALACAIFAAVCTGLLVKLANAHSDDGYKYILLMSVGLESQTHDACLTGWDPRGRSELHDAVEFVARQVGVSALVWLGAVMPSMACGRSPV